MGEAARKLEPEPEERDRLTSEMAVVAARAGLRVTVTQLRTALQDMPLERLRAAAQRYAGDIEDLQAMGIDVNDPSVWDEEGITLQEALEQELL